MLENQDQDLTLTDLSHNTLSYQLSQNLNIHHQSPVMIKDIIYYNYQKTEPQTIQVLNQTVSKTLTHDIMSPSSNSSSSPSSVSINPALKLTSQDSLEMSSKKKSLKKKSTQVTSEIDEERTSQLVSEILKNIKEKTKELESLNQNLKSTDQKYQTKINNVSQSESEYSKNYSQDSYDLNDSNDFYDSDGSKSTKQKKQKKKSIKIKSNKKLLEIPNGWSRIVDTDKNVIYISPSGFSLKSHQEIKNYLISDQTCKCGLECPLNIYETFNFSSLVDAVCSKKTSSKNSCLCKHVSHGIKKQKNLVKVLDEVNQNSKRNSNETKKTSKKVKKTDSYVNKTSEECVVNQHQQQSVMISNIVLSTDNFVNASNDLIFDTKNYSFSQANEFGQVEINSYSQNDIHHDNMSQSENMSFSHDFNDICQMVNSQSQL
ncbi:unnamed protein product [Brachionus calyciflorus]|uniref:MBD domain-containing protein n=1 Tax=Brachionus calyciflorus TaxID=104777 RepID=A0A813W6Z4_9BILA|nr:unnamed protein product [Brachionus calyciflorus]